MTRLNNLRSMQDKDRPSKMANEVRDIKEMLTNQFQQNSDISLSPSDFEVLIPKERKVIQAQIVSLQSEIEMM